MLNTRTKDPASGQSFLKLGDGSPEHRQPAKEYTMTFALVIIVATVWIIVSLPIALIIGRIPRLAERAELQYTQPTGSIGTITR